MTTAAATQNNRDPFMPERPPGLRSGLALALLAHALLIAGLAYSVDWHSSQPEAVEAELWSALPQQAAPRPVAPPPAPAPAPPPPPAPPPRPLPVQPPPPPQVDPQIAIEKAREAKRVQAQEELAEQDKARREKARRDQARQEADRKAEQQARDDAARKKQLADRQQADKAEQARTDKAAAAQREKDRQDQIKRMQSLAGATGESSATGNALRSSGPSASYAGRIVARIKPNIVFPDAVDGNPVASVEIRVAPDGSITAKRLVQSSGVKAWDDAVLRAIDRTDGLPRDIDGRVPPLMTINFRPRDL